MLDRSETVRQYIIIKFVMLNDVKAPAWSGSNALRHRDEVQQKQPGPNGPGIVGSCLLFLVLQLVAQHDIAKGQGVEQTAGLVGLAHNARRQRLAFIGGKQYNVNLIGHIGIAFLFGGQHLQVHNIGVMHRTIVNIVAAAHQRAALIGQTGVKAISYNLLSLLLYPKSRKYSLFLQTQQDFALKVLGIHKGFRRLLP